MEWWRIRLRLRFRYTREQKAAMAGKSSMTREWFWSCLDTAWKRYDRETFWQLWNRYPQYIREHKERMERQKEDDFWWAEMRPKLVEYLGEDWVKENCID